LRTQGFWGEHLCLAPALAVAWRLGHNIPGLSFGFWPLFAREPLCPSRALRYSSGASQLHHPNAAFGNGFSTLTHTRPRWALGALKILRKRRICRCNWQSLPVKVPGGHSRVEAKHLTSLAPAGWLAFLHTCRNGVSRSCRAEDLPLAAGLPAPPRRSSLTPQRRFAMIDNSNMERGGSGLCRRVWVRAV